MVYLVMPPGCRLPVLAGTSSSGGIRPGIPTSPGEYYPGGSPVLERGIMQPVEAMGCMRCALHNTRTNVVWGVGPCPANLVLVGEAPGYNEDRIGRPFVGRAGGHLDRLLKAAGIDRSQVYISNRVKCRPPGNREPLPSERATCKPWLDLELAQTSPQVVVLMGRHAATLAFPGGTLADIRRTVRAISVGEQVSIFVATYHPAAALRNPGLDDIIVDDLKWARGLLA